MAHIPAKNVLKDWTLTDNNRLYGQALCDQPSANVIAGDYLYTSTVQKMVRIKGTLYAYTKNSRYALI